MGMCSDDFVESEMCNKVQNFLHAIISGLTYPC